MAVTTLRAGVAGAGWWANRSHLPALRADPRVELVAVADRDPARARSTAQHWEVDSVHEDVETMLERERLDILVVSLPHALHHTATLAALGQGVDVLVEKPMALSGAHAWEMVRTSRALGRHLVVGTTFQFTPLAERAREILQTGRLGRLHLVAGCFASAVADFYAGDPVVRPVAELECIAPNPTPSPDTYSDTRLAGGGQAWTQLSHLVGMLTWVTGEAGVSVSAAMAEHGLPVDLVDAMWARFDSGALATIASTGGVRSGRARQELIYHGERGILVQDLGGRLSLNLADGTEELVQAVSGAEVYPRDAALRTLVDLVLGVTDRNPGEPVSAARATAMIEAAYASARTGETITIGDLPAGDG